MTVSINPTSMDDRCKRILRAYLDTHKHELVFKKGQSYKLYKKDLDPNANDEYIEFTLTHDVFWRARTNLKGIVGDRYEVIDQSNGQNIAVKIGEGGQGAVYRIACTLTPDDAEGFSVERVKGRVVKFETVTNDPDRDVQDEVAQKFELTKRVRHLHYKKPTVFQKAGGDYLVLSVMRYINAPNLQKLNLRAKYAAGLISTDQLLALTIAIETAVFEQVHNLGLIHCDLKPENILVDLTDPDNPQVYIIDYDLCKDQSDDDKGQICGTDGFMAPEVREGMGSDIDTDKFSLGRILVDLWHGDDPGEDEKSTAADVRAYKFTGLFQGINDLSIEHQGLLRNVITGLAHPYKNNRPAIIESTLNTRNILAERRLANIAKAKPADVPSASGLAVPAQALSLSADPLDNIEPIHIALPVERHPLLIDSPNINITELTAADEELPNLTTTLETNGYCKLDQTPEQKREQLLVTFHAAIRKFKQIHQQTYECERAAGQGPTLNLVDQLQNIESVLTTNIETLLTQNKSYAESFYPIVVEHLTDIIKQLANPEKSFTMKDLTIALNRMDQQLLQVKPLPASLKTTLFGVIGAIAGFILGAVIGAFITSPAFGFGAIPAGITGAAIGSSGAGYGFFDGCKRQRCYQEKLTEIQEVREHMSKIVVSPLLIEATTTNAVQGMYDL